MTTNVKKAYYKIKSSNRNLKDYMLCEVSLIDSKNTYGQDLCQIEPVSGSGRIWVRVNTLQIR